MSGKRDQAGGTISENKDTVHYLVSDIIMMMGNEEQKAKYLPMACEGKLGAFCLTEPGAGSHAGGLKTKAVKDGSDYIINGTKCFITNCGPNEGDYFVVIVLTDPEKKTHGGMTAFLVDRDNPGLSIGKTENKMGIKGSETSELVLTDCRVPETAILSKIGDGFKIAMVGLDGGRIGIASQTVGIAEGALAEAVKYASERVQFGKPIGANQGLQWYIADMATRAEAACYVTDLALQIHGGYGYMKDYPIERMYRDARITRIYEGTSEVQKMVIARSVMH